MNEVIRNPETKLHAAIKAAQEAMANRSFSGRHPELGRMVNCQICKRRHRAANVCLENGVLLCDKCFRYHYGECERSPRMPKAKRYFPHHSKHDLQLIERTREVFNRLTPSNGVWFPKMMEYQLMKISKITAEKELKAEQIARTKQKRRQQDTAQRINRGLLPGGSR